MSVSVPAPVSEHLHVYTIGSVSRRLKVANSLLRLRDMNAVYACLIV